MASARELLFRFGVLEPSEYLDEMLALGGEQATNLLRNLGNAELARMSRSDLRAVAMLRVRGALYATRVDAQIRKATKGQRRLDPIIVGLIKEARDALKAVPASVFVDKLRSVLGPDAEREFDSLVVRGQPVELPAEALGPCFPTIKMRYPIEAAGFDPDGTLASPERRVTGLAADGAAAKAGLLAQEVVSQIRAPSVATKGKMEVVVVRDGKEVTIAFSPYAGFVAGQGWKRDPQVKDDKCLL